MDKQEVNKLKKEFVEILGETNLSATWRIARIIQHAGLDFAQALLAETEKIEAQGGLMTLDGSRRRTKSGVFLFLARSRLDKETRNKVFYPPRPKKKQVVPENAENEALPSPETETQ